MDDRLGDIDTNIYKLSNDVEELTTQRFQTWETDHLSQLLAHHHINHTRYDGTRYTYVPDILDLGVQQGVNFMASLQDFSITPTASTDLFGMFGTPGARPSTSHNF
ncbi:hypothetical protein Tco_0749474 [Tanacetum coccineum]|uniref:Uncharacterized protein n=1 Tax=Tanacetum coccineum TaxID=301880 RepID=A0ABQ4YYH4_9ASTR